METLDFFERFVDGDLKVGRFRQHFKSMKICEYSSGDGDTSIFNSIHSLMVGTRGRGDSTLVYRIYTHYYCGDKDIIIKVEM